MLIALFHFASGSQVFLLRWLSEPQARVLRTSEKAAFSQLCVTSQEVLCVCCGLPRAWHALWGAKGNLSVRCWEEQVTISETLLSGKNWPGWRVAKYKEQSLSSYRYIFFFLSIVDLECCVNFCGTAKWLSYYWLNGHEFEQIPGDGEGQGSLGYCSPWGCKESDATERLHNTMSVCVYIYIYIHSFKIFFIIMVCPRILNTVPCAIQQDLIVYPPYIQ